jgi:hypothetical protein
VNVPVNVSAMLEDCSVSQVVVDGVVNRIEGWDVCALNKPANAWSKATERTSARSVFCQRPAHLHGHGVRYERCTRKLCDSGMAPTSQGESS